MRVTLALLALGLVLVVPANARAAIRIEPGRYAVKAIGAFKTTGEASLALARRAFGKPSSTRTPGDDVCNARWEDLKLKITFVELGGGDACDDGAAQTFRAEGERFATWRGLRVRGSARAVLERHPDAERHRSSFWLKTATSRAGDGSRYPVVQAQFGAGRVTGFKGFIGAAGE